MKKYFYILLPFVALLPGFTNAIGKDIDLNAGSISDSMKLNANAVMRYYDVSLEVQSFEKAVINTQYAVTILNEKADHYASIAENYSLLYRITKMEGRILDASGKVIGKMKSKDVYDRSTYGYDFTFHSDHRVKTFSFPRHTYPYTVEFEIQYELKTLFFLPSWAAQRANYCSVESATFSVKSPKNINIRYKAKHVVPEENFTEEVNDQWLTRRWKSGRISASLPEPGYGEDNLCPEVHLAADSFHLLGYSGIMDNWQNLGRFHYELNKGRDELPDNQKALVRSMIAGKTSVREKVDVLYQYLQTNTRYVANEYGIAGWQTFDAASVSKNGYGDCKGLTNYMKAMLKEAGIVSYPVLIYGSENIPQFDAGFPSLQFNHVILCVPQQQDSIWLECTSTTLPTGYLGCFTQGRTALLITENGGELVHTPKYNKNQNSLSRNFMLRINQVENDQKVQISYRYTGMSADDPISLHRSKSKDAINRHMREKYPFTSYTLQAYDVQEDKTSTIPALNEQAEVLARNLTSVTQKRTFVQLGWIANPMTDLYQVQPRTKPFTLHRSYSVTDSIRVIIASGTDIESLPKSMEMKMPFAAYQTQTIRDGNEILLVRRFEQNEGTYPVSDYEKYQEMFQAISRSNRQLNLVLLHQAQ